jgi:hypothetical protein
MKESPDNRNARLDENDPVWQLLARAPQPEPDAWFTARTLARCRQAGEQLERGWMPIGRIWRWALGGGLGVCLAVVLMVTQMQVQSTAPAADQKNVQEAFEVVANLGSDSDSSSTSSTWQDNSL